jgi:hypothetical protein
VRDAEQEETDANTNISHIGKNYNNKVNNPDFHS